jgi:hypothetical protein
VRAGKIGAGLVDLPGAGQWNDDDVVAQIAAQDAEEAEAKEVAALKERGVEVREQDADTRENKGKGGKGGGAKTPKPLPAFLTSKERGQVSEIDAASDSLASVRQKVASGDFKTGLGPDLWSKFKRVAGMRGSEADLTRAELAGVLNQAMHGLYGSALTKQEIERALSEMPAFTDDNTGLVSFIDLYSKKLENQKAKILNTARSEAQARGISTDGFDKAYGIDEEEPPPSDKKQDTSRLDALLAEKAKREAAKK